METKLVQDKLVEFENNSRVLEYKYNYKDILIWPHVRSILFRKVVDSVYGFLPPAFAYTKKENKYRDYIKYNSFNLPKKDILFISSSTGLVESGDKIFDRLIDDFVKLEPDSSAKMIEYHKDFDFDKLSKMGIPFSTDTFIKRIIEYEGEKKKDYAIEVERINEFLDFLKREIPVKVEEGIYEAVRKEALKIIKEYPAYYKYYKKLIDIVQPKLVICNCGIYGRPQIKIFNDYGIMTAEYQHGAVDRYHEAYRYGKQVAENEIYKQYMPKYLLTWGEFWLQGLDLPTNIYKIGNPTVQKNIDKFKEMQSNVDNQFNILIITTVYHEIYVDFINYILSHLPEDFKVIVKLHPTRQEDIKYYDSFLHNKRVDVVRNGLIYDYFHICKYVVGDFSTAMYEAAAVGKEVFIMDIEYVRNRLYRNVGTWIRDGKQFVDIISKTREYTFDGEDFFESNWQQNYLNFIKDIVYKNQSE